MSYRMFDKLKEGLDSMGVSHVNTPIIYVDFYFVEALAKLNGNNEIFW